MGGYRGWWYKASLTLLLFLSLALPSAAATVSGYIDYAGSMNGRLFVNARAEGGGEAMYGVSVPRQLTGPTYYEIRGIPDGTYTVTAVLDTVGDQVLRASAPHGSSAPQVVNTSAKIDLNISDQTDPAFLAAPTFEVIPGESIALMHWNVGRDENGLVLADEATVYWSSDPDVLGTYQTLGGFRSAPVAGAESFAYTWNLINGTPYYFVLKSRRGSVWSEPATVGNVILVDLPTNSTYSITVPIGTAYPPPTIDIHVVLLSTSGNGVYMFKNIGQFDGNGDSVIPVFDVPPGQYRILAAYDKNNDGIIEANEPNNYFDGAQPLTVGTNGTVNLGQATSTRLATWHEKDAQGNSVYTLKFDIAAMAAQVVNVKLVNGPQLAGPVDLALNPEGGFGFSLPLMARPNIGDTYELSVETTDSGSFFLYPQVTRVVDDFPTPMAPIGVQPYTTGKPDFTWNAPIPTPAYAHSYSLSVSGDNTWWDANDIQGQSASYNFNGWANQSTLSNDQCYRWRIALCDEQGNCAAPAPADLIYGSGVCGNPGTSDPIDFESGVLEPGWSSYGNSNWFVTSDSTHSGNYAMRSGYIYDAQSSTLELSKTVAAGQVSFWYRISSETSWDYLRFYIDGIEQGAWSGDLPWAQASFPVTAGPHSFGWVYSKDGSVSNYADAAWIDDVTFSAASGGGAVDGPTVVANGIADVFNSGAINDLGEMVWFQDVGGDVQLISSQRGQLTSAPFTCSSPAINNLGEVVWDDDGNGIWALLAGQTTPTVFGNGGQDPDINDHGEIVWIGYVAGYTQIFSSLRGQLTFDPAHHEHPSIANDGSVVWTSNGTVYRLDAGAAAPVEVAGGNVIAAAISNSGEIVYQKMENGNGRLFSSTRGQLTFTLPPGSHEWPDINACGDVVFNSYDYYTGSNFYRLGYNAPCVDAGEPNNAPGEATALAFGQAQAGVLDATSDSEDWYLFDASVGASLYVTINWDATPPNTLFAELFDQNGYPLQTTQDYQPNRLTLSLPTTPYSGSYKLHLRANAGRFGYAVKIAKTLTSCGGGTDCPTVVVSNLITNSASINDLGEMVWAQDVGGYWQIFSSQRGQLTFGTDSFAHPAINNLGEVVWQGGYVGIWGLLNGQTTPIKLHDSGEAPDINDHGEIVWFDYAFDGTSYHSQIFSSLRGQLTFDPAHHENPSIANDGTVTWVGDSGTAYRLDAGASAPVVVASGEVWTAAIANSGEIVYSQQAGPFNRLFSDRRGQLPPSLLAGGQYWTDVNACGDVIYTDSIYGDYYGNITLYRIGNKAPCVDAGEPNNAPAEAAALPFGQVQTGVLDAMTDTDDWYLFDASAGAPLYVTINWNATPPNTLFAELFDPNGYPLQATQDYQPSRLTLSLPMAPYSGSYKLHLRANGGRFGYAVKLAKTLASCGGPADCPAVVANGVNGSSSINDLGEMVWAQDVGGYWQIFSSQRGQLTFGTVSFAQPAINNLGEVVWQGMYNNSIWGLLNGQATPAILINGGYAPDINDHGEIVWFEYVFDGTSLNSQIFSSLRGQLTFDPASHENPSIANDGTVTWVGNAGTAYRLDAGASAPVVVASGGVWDAAIANSGEIVYSQQTSFSQRLFSDRRGQLPPLMLAGGQDWTDVNACGDVIYTDNIFSDNITLYRLGNNAPCATETDSDGDTMPDAWEIANGLNPNDLQGGNSPAGDLDGDGLPNLREYFAGTAANLADSDGDGLNDQIDPQPLVAAVVAPALIAPGGSVASATPTLSWNAAANATGYDLYTSRGGVATTTSYTAEELGCATGTACSVVSPTLPNGASVYWVVRAKNAAAKSDWSVAKTFTVTLLPAVPTLIAPSGSVASATPTLSWNAAANASGYDLYTSSGGVATTKSYTAEELGCATGTVCSVVSSPLPNGTSVYWVVRAKNAVATSDWSSAMTLNVSLLPAVPTLVGPSGTVVTLTPTYTWNAAANAVSYELYRNIGGVGTTTSVTAAEAGCATGSVCSVVSPALANGTSVYWVVRAKDAVATSNWSSSLTFTVKLLPAVPTLIAPNGSVASSTPTLSWNAAANATGYDLYTNSGGVATTKGYTPEELGCATGTVCSIVSSPLANGASVYWVVRAKNSVSKSDWSSAKTFKAQY